MASTTAGPQRVTRLERLSNELQQKIYALAIWKEDEDDHTFDANIEHSNIDLSTVRSLRMLSHNVATNVLSALRRWPAKVRKMRRSNGTIIELESFWARDRAINEVEIYIAVISRVDPLW